MPIPSRNLGKCFDAAAAPDKVAIVELRDPANPRAITYRALDEKCNAVARGLLKRGYKRGDRIGILSLNRLEYLYAYFGTMRAGLVSVPISFKLGAEVVKHISDDARLKAVFHDTDRIPVCPPGVARIGYDDGGFDALLDPGAFDTVEPDPRELAMLLYTSGSTGMPKGVLLSHDSQRWSMETAAKLYGERSHHRYIVGAPMFHMNATISVKGALASGASIVFLPAFDAKVYARAIQDHRVTWLTSVPTMLALVAKKKELLSTLDFSSVTNVTMGSAPLTQALIDKIQALFPKALINNSYGTTEAGPAPFGIHPNGIPRPSLACGYPVPGSEAELREGPNADEGVLYMRSPMMMEGYNNLPEKTGAVLKDGWYRSGDIFRRDKDGFFYFVGRADDMFVVGGENVWPGEVERLLERMPGVHQACVVPVPDDIKGAIPFAFVVASPGANPTEAEIKQFALANGPAYAHPRFVAFRNEIPLAATNKPDRKKLIAEAEGLSKGKRPTL
jgi:acyl-CoA synthetase (AMP-forming)/AMP-acid ligase II